MPLPFPLPWFSLNPPSLSPTTPPTHPSPPPPPPSDILSLLTTLYNLTSFFSLSPPLPFPLLSLLYLMTSLPFTPHPPFPPSVFSCSFLLLRGAFFVVTYYRSVEGLIRLHYPLQFGMFFRSHLPNNGRSRGVSRKWLATMGQVIRIERVDFCSSRYYDLLAPGRADWT